jgi:hypothetical protein
MARRIAAYDAFSVSRGVMDNRVIRQAEGDEKMLAFDIPNEV